MDITGSTLTPVIISASRETDLPCFFSDWFLERLKEGWCAWKNTYSGTIHKVSFAKARMIVFWSKNPRPLLRRLDEVEALGFRNYYFQFTLNDYEREGLEPNVAPLDERIDTFRELADRIGKERVIWRFDPLMLGCATGTVVGPPVCGATGTVVGPPVCGAAGTMPGPPVCDTAGTKPGPPVCGAAGTKPGPPVCGLSVDVLLERIGNIGRQLKGYTEKLVFSFIDIEAYRKVQRNLEGLCVREFSPEEQLRFAQGLAELNKELGLELATCGEEVDLSAYGVRHNKCVDDDLMMRLFHDDAEL
ncbi:MAG: DUF1848 family protein, partial [Bacteroidales bacterium]|nr:DUF1848 family protein [Bacteroidales bacterium]